MYECRDCTGVVSKENAVYGTLDKRETFNKKKSKSSLHHCSE